MKKMIKFFIAIVTLLVMAFIFPFDVVKAEENIIYVGVNGSSDASGEFNDPLDIRTALEESRSGTTIYIFSGTYKLGERITIVNSGNTKEQIKVYAYDINNRPVIDFCYMEFNSNNRGIQLNASYWYFFGIDVCNAGDNGMYISGNHNTIEYCNFYNNRDSGLQLGRASSLDTSVTSWPSYNLIKNCTSYNNYDDETYGENADGFAAKLTVGYANVFDGCIAYRNSDDGWDLYAKSDTGNVGTVIIMNCLAFENGWLLDGSTTRDGDGIGFKLGGSNMEGDVICINSMAFNNRLHGFSDNSNPRTIIIKNCTAYNNSVKVVDGEASYNDGGSANFNLARTKDSYNAYYGLLSYSTNQVNETIDYSVYDEYVGSTAYSIFTTGKNIYYTIKDYIDASSYEKEKMGVMYSGMRDSIFESINFNYSVDDYKNIYKLLRNEDYSINVGSMLNVVDKDLLTYCNGKQIGAKLNYTSYDAYEHYTNTSLPDNANVDMIRVYSAYDALMLMCDKDAVYQDFPVWNNINDVDITWKSSDESLLSFRTDDIYTSLSGVSYMMTKINRSSQSNKEVTLTATLKRGDFSLDKSFTITLRKDNPKLGSITGLKDTYMVDIYEKFTNPSIEVTNKTSNSGQLLKDEVDYFVKRKFEYAESTNDEFNTVSKVYTSVPGVYRVTYIIKSYADSSDTLSQSFLVYVISPTNPVDFVNKVDSYNFYVCRDGVHITGDVTNVSGHVYVLLSNNSTETKETVLEKGEEFIISSDTIDLVAENDNVSDYYIHVVIENNAKTYKSNVYTKKVNIEEIETCDDFYNLVMNSTSSTTIYLLKSDLDFSSYNFDTKTRTVNFKGLFNGDGYTIKNITITGSSDKSTNIFYKLEQGTIMNVSFENIVLKGDMLKSKNVAIIGQACGGYLDNIKLRNITSEGYQTVGGLVGQVCGEETFISRVSLINDYTFDNNYNLSEDSPYMHVSTKYLGGIVANIQKDTTESRIICHIENCFVDAYLGDSNDSGGYVGGIVGRIKNDMDIYLVEVDHSVFDGIIVCGKNYTGGIIGGCEAGSGVITISNNVSRPTIIFGSTRTVIDGKTLDEFGTIVMSHKTASPILGRYTAGLGTYNYINNYATFSEYNSQILISVIEEDLEQEYTYKNYLKFDFDIWEFNSTTKIINLKFLTRDK